MFTPATFTYASLSGDQSNQNFIFGKKWNGAGSDNLASNPNNWLGGVVPSTGDVVRFDATNANKGCFWDLVGITVTAIQLKVAFSSSVVVGQHLLGVDNIEILGGEFLTGPYEVHVNKNFLHTGGRFRSTAGGTYFWEGSILQTISMVKTSLGSGLYDSYFTNFRVNNSSTVRATSDLVMDGIFNISAGRFEAVNTTHTLTGGTQSGVGGSFNWDDSGGTFVPGSGQVVFNSVVGGSYLIRQGASNSFFDFKGIGSTALSVVTGININGNLVLGESGSTVHMSLGDGFIHTIAGTTSIGPASTSGSPTLSVGGSSITFQGTVLVGTGTFSMQSSQIYVHSGKLEVTSQGTLEVQSGGTSGLTFWDATQLKLSEGSLLIQGGSVFASSAPGVARFSTDLRGTINIQVAAVFDSMDVNGLQLGIGANPLNLMSLGFRNGITGGAALNFNPVSVSSVTVNSPNFDVSFSTNIRAVLDTSVVSNSDIQVINSTGAHTGPSYENDPNGIVNWGTIGTPLGFSGTALGVSSITWAWTAVNNPLGFVVKSSTGGALSPTLAFNTTYWTEIGLSTNTQHTRYVEAFTDVDQADSSSVSIYTLAAPAANLSVVDVGISSITLSWSANSNPADTTFLLERSTNDVSYAQIASGVFTSLVPTLDQNLTAEKLYYYRVRVQNGDGLVVSESVKTSATTTAVPPPSVLSIVPSTGENLGNIDVTVTGSYIQSGALVRLMLSAQQVITPSTFQVQNSTTLTAAFNLTGAYATAWDVEIENPDGKISIGTGGGLFTITDAASNATVAIRNYSSSSVLVFTTPSSESSVTMDAGAMSNGRIYLSVDPENTSLTVDTSLITSANANMGGLVLIPGSIREILAFTSAGAFTTAFNAAVTLGIAYPDVNHDGVVDSVALRSSTLRMVTLNQTSGRWQLITGATIDSSNTRVTASLSHFSVYALVASPAAENLSEVKVYPSPWMPGASTKFDATHLTIANLTEEGTIGVYSLDARLVREIKYDITNAGVAVWDGIDKNGGAAPSGIYLVYVKSSVGETATLKVGIER